MTLDQNMLNEFISEAREHLSSIEADFLALEDKDNQKDRSYIDRIFRAVHSIKGSSSFLNLGSITRVAHAMEALIQKCRDNSIEIGEHHIDALLEGVDILSKFLDDPTNSENISTNGVCEHLKNLSTQSTVLNQKNNSQISYGTSDSTEIVKYNKTNRSKTDEKYLVENQIFADTNYKKLDTITLQHLNNMGFKHDFSELPVSTNLYILVFNIFEIEEMNSFSPVQFFNDLIGIGNIIDARTDIHFLSIEEISETRILIFEVLYETKLNHEELNLLLNIPEKCITKIEEKIDNNKKQENKHQQEWQSNQSRNFNASEISKSSNKTERKFTDSIIHTKTSESKKTTEKTSQNISSPIKKSNNDIKVETLRISIEILDKIMNLAGELVLVRNQHMLVVDKQNTKQSDIAQRLDMVTSELQEAIMRTRMQPVGNLFSKLPRIVRDLGKKLSKSIVIITKGDDVELDKNILESLSDPLIHIIRNACDHGIEMPEQRIINGKSETGYIKVSAYHEAGQINIKIEDDGKGIDPDEIKKIAIERKIKSKNDLDLMSGKDLIRLIMLPGFSTASKTTEVSGRGVGMDVVKKAVEDMSGNIDMYSEKGNGTIIHLRLPLTLAIIPSLIVVVNNERLAIPEVNVEELVSLFDNEIFTKIETNGDQEVFRLRNKLLPLVRLNEVLSRKKTFNESVRFEISEKYSHLAQKELASETDDLKVVLIFAVLKVGNHRFGLIVDEVPGTEEIVVNPIHSLVKNIKIFSGTTIMGDGTVALILDVNGIVDHCGLVFSSYSDKHSSKDIFISRSDTHRILLFKSGQKEQFAVPLLLLKRVEIIDLENIQGIGDREFISIEGKTIQIVRLDNELNVSTVTENKRMFLLIPKQSPHPFGLIASKLIDVINMPLELNKEDCIEEGFLGTALIGEKITLFIDIFKLTERIFPTNTPEPLVEKESSEKETKVLIVEDTVFFRRLISGQLESEGFKVSTAENGIMALKLLEKEEFDIIVSDIEMPEMDGLTLIKTLRRNENYKSIPAIAVTSLDSPEDRDAGLKAGFNEYEVKIDKESLIKNIYKLLKTKEN